MARKQASAFLASVGLLKAEATPSLAPPLAAPREAWLLLIVAVVSAAVLLPIVLQGIPNGADLPNHLRFAMPFYESIKAGTLYPGWLAESNYGFGDPRFRFYPPGLYYLLTATRFLTGDWYWATVAAFLLIAVAGGLGVYFWARAICEPKIAMLAAIFYAVVPYHLNELYQASLLSEYAACSVLPFAFAFVERICRRRRAVDVAGLGAAYALLILTHLPLTVIGSLSLLIYGLFRLEKKTWLATLGRLALGVTLGLAASAFFWTTMVAELPWIKGGSVESNVYYDYRANFLFSSAALTNLNTWYANVLSVALIGFLLPALVLVVRFFRSSNRSLRAALLLTTAAFLMATPLSRPLWAIVPGLSQVQFPWRWLAITSLSGCVILAASLPKWKEKLRTGVRAYELLVALAFVLSLGYSATQIVWECDYINRARLEPMLVEMRGAVSFKDWLPIGARDIVHVEKIDGNVQAGDRPITVTSWAPQHRTFHVEPGAQTTARVRTYFYPYWVAMADGQQLATSAAPDGALLVSLPPNATNVDLIFREPPRVRRAAIASGLSWLLIAVLLGTGWRRRVVRSTDSVLTSDSESRNRNTSNALIGLSQNTSGGVH
jgi:6-pyruvoyl-tetrahydropterin synthase-like protein